MRSALVLTLIWLMIMASVGAILSGLIGLLRSLLAYRKNAAAADRIDRQYIEDGTEGTMAWRRRYVNRRRQREGRPPLE